MAAYPLAARGGRVTELGLLYTVPLELVGAVGKESDGSSLTSRVSSVVL